MRCDVLAVGTELLLGQIVDTNSSWIGEQLAAHGISSHLQVKVGDNIDRIVMALRARLEEADAVIMCGGLGPTHDDLTREAIAQVMGVELEFHESIAEVIRELFASRGRTMAQNNLQQAMVPKGASIIAQTRGTAPGLMCPVLMNGKTKMVYAVPGVPHEMHDMMHRAILPDLVARSGVQAVIASKVLRTWGESESGLNERLNGIIAELENNPDGSLPTLAFLASGWEGIKVRLTARAATSEQVSQVLATWEERVRGVVGDIVFGVDSDTMESVVLQTLRSHGHTLAVAESVTGGLVTGRLTNIAGASDVLVGGVVSYASEVKYDVLNVPRGPVVSGEAAIAMARGVKGHCIRQLGSPSPGSPGHPSKKISLWERYGLGCALLMEPNTQSTFVSLVPATKCAKCR